MPIGSSLAEQRTVVSMLLWGREGTGKTTAGLRMVNVAPKGAVVLINAEAGAKKLALERLGIDTSRIEVWPPEDKGPGYITYETINDEVIAPIRAALAADPNAYIGIVIDSFSEVARRILEDVVAKAQAKASSLGKTRDKWQTDLQDHGIAASQMRSLLRRFRDLNIHLVITALERRDTDEATAAMTYGPALGPSVGSDTMGLVDLVGFCAVETIGGTEFRTATFTPTLTRRAKDRFGVLPPSLVDPFTDRVVGYISGKINRENDPARKRLLDAIANKDEEAPPEPEKAKPEPAESEASKAAK